MSDAQPARVRRRVESSRAARRRRWDGPARGPEAGGGTRAGLTARSAGRPFPSALLAPVLVATAAAAATPGFPLPAAIAVVVAAAVRGLWLRGGREIVAPRAWMLLWASSPAIATAYASAIERVGGRTAPALLGAGAIATAAAIVAPSTTTGWARLLGLAGLLIAGACLAAPERIAVLSGLAFVVLLVPAALSFGEAPPRSSAAGSEGLVRRVHATRAMGTTSLRASVGVVGVLLLLGLPVGLLFFKALPTNPTGAERQRSAELARARRLLDRLEPAAGGSGTPDASNEPDWLTGPTAGTRSDFHKTLRPSAAVVLTVRVGEGVRGPEPLWLRGTTYDDFDGRAWTRSAKADAAQYAPEDPARPGWLTIGPSADPAAIPTVRVRVVDIDARAARTALWLLPGASRVHLDGRAGGLAILRSADGDVRVTPPDSWMRGDAYETVGPFLGVDRDGIGERASSASVAPLPSTVLAPPEARLYRELAARIVGDLKTPSERAARIEAYLRSPPFTHDMVELPLNPRRPVADFLVRVRRGHCWCFASAMTALMRSLGHSARFATGLRGGAWKPASGTYDFRGHDAHAWCEVFYQGRGWVIYDPTPPSIEPGDDAEASLDAMSDDDERSAWDTFTGLFTDDRPGRLSRLGDALERMLRAIGSSVVGIVATIAILALTAFVVVGLVRRRREGGPLGLKGSPSPRSPYARALSALAGGGVPRRRSETPVEFGARAGAVIPSVAEPLALLTVDHDSERYGGRAADDAVRARDDDAARRVADAAHAPARPTPPTRSPR